jgi:uncharacterized protein YjbI with pentapeptide repeats
VNLNGDMEASGNGTEDLRQGCGDNVSRRRLTTRFSRWRQEHPTSLFTASALAIAVLSVFAVALWFGLARVLVDKPPWELGDSETTEFSVMRMVLFILAGAVGVIGVVVAYRRQHSAEQGRFLERLADASRLLGDPNPTVQAAGIYALAGLADTEGRDRRQQCVDVLCAYIRLPYAPAPTGHEPEALESIKRKRTMQIETGEVEEERTLFRPHDRHTRETIISAITQHLRKDAKVSWSDLKLDFTHAVFDYGDFSQAVFTGHAGFLGARFVGGTVDFRGATFSGGTLDFRGATFSGGTVDFQGATFSGGTVDFTCAQFSGGTVDFGSAEFSGGTVQFQGATFSGGAVYFVSATFSGGTVEFRGGTIFPGATFSSSGGTIQFPGATFSGGIVHFGGARFFSGTVSFQGVLFDGSTVSFKGARFDGSTVDFTSATFSGGTVEFLGPGFSGGTVDFTAATFSGGTVDIMWVGFYGGTVDFQSPRDWSTPPKVPWGDGDEPPTGVMPRMWPPEH